MTKAQKERSARLLLNGTPRYVHCYANGGESVDRYTVVFTGNYQGREGCSYLSMSAAPFHPQGFGQHGWSRDSIDYPTYGHLGKRITFDQLPTDCQTLVLNDYMDYWRLYDTKTGAKEEFVTV